MVQDIAKSETELSYWGAITVSNKGAEIEASFNGQDKLVLDEIDDGSPIVKIDGESTKTHFYFNNPQEMQLLGKWLQKQGELVDEWNKKQAEIVEEAESKENPEQWIIENRVPVDEWWGKHG